MQKASGKILIVDDNPIQVEHLKICLLKLGYNVHFTTKADEAINIAELKMPDLILLDVVMPEEDGYAVCRILKSNASTKDIPVIFITSKSEKWDKIKGFDTGAFDYITKPFSIEEVLARIRNAVSLKQFQDELKRKNNVLEVLSIRDELTLLYNRRYVLKRIAEEIERAKRYNHIFACVMIDIDHFKKINDTYGHPIGDIVLRHMGELLRKNLRAVDIAARYGGEEFLLILPETELTGAKAVAEKLLHLISQSSPPEGLPQDFRFTISLGIAIYPSDAENRDSIISAADKALYAAKESGRNCYRAFSSMNCIEEENRLSAQKR